MPESIPITIAIEDPDQPDIRAMLVASDAYMTALYPAESNHLVEVSALQSANVHFLVGRRGRLCVACGAVVLAIDGTAEIKRMWVEPHARGSGLGRRILATIEKVARREGAEVLRLETGISQVEAINLYRSAGFSAIAAFGEYQPDPLSIFMEKRLPATPPKKRPRNQV